MSAETETEKQSTVKENRVIITASDAARLKKEVVGMKRAALNIELNAKVYAAHADNLIKLYDLLKTEPDEPASRA